ncbi:MAG: glycosyltransferase [Evtepia gabavorous]
MTEAPMTRWPLPASWRRSRRGSGSLPTQSAKPRGCGKDRHRGLPPGVPAGDLMCLMDGDDTHKPRFIHGMLAKITREKQCVIASRYQPGHGSRGSRPAESSSATALASTTRWSSTSPG